MERMSSHDDGGAGERRDGVEVPAKHHRDLVDEQIAQHSAADGRQHPEQRGRERIAQ